MTSSTTFDKALSSAIRFRRNRKVCFLIALALLAGCALEEGKLNDKLVNKPLKERLVILQQQCLEASNYRGATSLSGDSQYKFLLPKLCDGMGEEILRIVKAPDDENIAADFGALSKRCVAESHNKNIRWGRNSRNLDYAFKAEAICSVYQEEFLKIHPEKIDQSD